MKKKWSKWWWRVKNYGNWI